MKRFRLLAAIAAAGMLVAACGGGETTTDPTETEGSEPAASETGAPNADWPEQIVFGFVPSREAEELQDDIQPFIDVLEEALGIDVEGFVASEYAGLVEAMGSGQADLGAFGPTGYVLAAQRFDIEPLIQSIRFGSATFHGQYFTNDPTVCDEDPVPGAFAAEGELVGPTDTAALQVGWTPDGEPEVLEDGTEVDPGLACTVSDLAEAIRGRTMAYGSETSTSGFIFPALKLLNLGLDWQTDYESNFTGGHDQSVTAVYNGDADFGVSFDDARRNIREEFPDVGSKVIVIDITPEVPNDVVAVRSDLPDDLKEAIYAAVEDFLATEEGQAIFDEIYGWTDIQRANDADFDIVREAIEKIGAEG